MTPKLKSFTPDARSAAVIAAIERDGAAILNAALSLEHRQRLADETEELLQSAPQRAMAAGKTAHLNHDAALLSPIVLDGSARARTSISHYPLRSYTPMWGVALYDRAAGRSARPSSL